MLTIDAGKEKKLEFAISLVGRFTSSPNSFFRIYCKDFNIGFPAKIDNFEKVVIIIPKLTDYLKIPLPDSAHASLEIISDRDIFMAWQDKIKIKQIDIKAELEDEKEEE